MKPGDLVIPKYHRETNVPQLEPELVLELDHGASVIDDQAGIEYVFWNVLRVDGTVGKICDTSSLDGKSLYEVIACGSEV